MSQSDLLRAALAVVEAARPRMDTDHYDVPRPLLRELSIVVDEVVSSIGPDSI